MTVTTKSAFRMHALREILPSIGGSTYLESLMAALEGAVTENPALAFDFAKSLIESVCKTILKERAATIESNWDLPRLFQATLDQLVFLPAERGDSDKTDKAIKKTVGALQTVVQGLCELRNLEGGASHGKDAYWKSLDPLQAELAAHAADTVACFLLGSHLARYPMPGKRRIRYEEQKDFNDHVDDMHGQIQIFNVFFRPSEVLYHLDYEAYHDALIEFEDALYEDGGSSSGNE
ncbi:MAG: hypothetical protein KatS3mg051_1248 [Anaerolineae bacterium]|nr:MAG: hypothetical protein KatS3mg051_1248 [Anaerolineae bacterium]